MDLLGNFLRVAPRFKGRGRLTHYWLHHNRTGGLRRRALPGGAVIHCDMSVPYECMVWLGREEEDDLAALRRILQPGQTFVDCGANIGLWTLTAATAVEPEGKVYAFEPNPVTFTKLLQNVKSSALEAVASTSCVACGDQIAESPFLCGSEHNISRMAARLERDAKETVLVPVTTLDTALRNLVIHGIKIDVEGHELQVLQGSEEILKRSKPWLCVEFNTLLAGLRRLADWEVHRYLAKFGYACCRMSDAPSVDPQDTLGDDFELDGYSNLFYFIP